MSRQISDPQNARERGRAAVDANETTVGAADIKDSESGEDVDPGRTPGKAEGVHDPEIDGNR